jgi:hypothetical protein
MIVHLKTLPVASDSHPVTEAISTLAALIPAQIDQTRKQISQLASTSAAQVAVAATTGALGASGALAGSVVAELAMSKVEDKVYELTSPALESSSPTREAIVSSTRQELRLQAKGVELEGDVNGDTQVTQEGYWAADPGMSKEPKSLLGSTSNPTDQEAGSILEHAFGPKIDRLRERNRILSDRNRPILSR